MNTFHKHLIAKGSTIRQALERLDKLAMDAILFVVTEDQKLIGSLTDGDVRRGLLKGFTIENLVEEIIQPNPKFLRKGDRDINKVIEYREKNFRVIPILDKEDHVVNVINFREIKSYLPVDAVIMAGGKGERLRPLTENLPKPLIKVGDKTIIEHNIDRLRMFGIDDFWITLHYLGHQIEEYCKDGREKNITIKYVHENEPLGTIGALSKIQDFVHDFILVSNSDLLTNMDYENFFLDFLDKDADLSVVTIPYKVDIPYAVLETNNGSVINFIEKPTFTYFSNGGIYLMKKSTLGYLPAVKFFNATDLIETLIKNKKKVVSYPMTDFWLDIGRHEDLEKAVQIIKHLKPTI